MQRQSSQRPPSPYRATGISSIDVEHYVPSESGELAVRELEGLTVLITGSARGIGAATARLARQRGATVILHGRTESPELLQIAEELESPWMACDVRDRQAVSDAVRRVLDVVPRIDALVNNAGSTSHKTILEIEDDDWQRVFSINLVGPVHFVQAAVPHMLECGTGRIVNLSSMVGHSVNARPRNVAYGVAKAGMQNLTSAMAKAFAPAIAVNCVSPGFTTTDISRGWNERAWADARRSLVQRPADAKEIAEVVLFLAGPRSSFVTGQTWLVDGGFTLSGN
jgi:NAD(P)-dependent dehydrogenase (short-subunit alcohol dehydrogenase family)